MKIRHWENFFDPFESEDLNAPGIIHKDGTVTTAPNRDIVSEISIEGERKINWAIMGFYDCNI